MLSSRLKTLVTDLRWRAIQRLETDLHELRYLFWESTRRCNLSCRHCGSDCSKDDLAGLDRATVVAALKRIAGAYGENRIMLVVTGGEPLMRPDLVSVLRDARELGFRLGMVTNGYALDPRRARSLAAVGLESVVVSLDGPPELHNWLRNRADAFERASRAVRALVEERVPIVEAITCVTPRSLPRLGETYDIVRALGASHWRVFNIFPAGRAVGNRELLLDEAGIADLVARVDELRRRGQRDQLIVNLSEEGYLGWQWECKVRDTPYFCRAGVSIAGIMADGAIAACPNLPASMAQGRLPDDDFVQVWEERYQRFRDRSWTRVGKCADCDEWNTCRGGSLHLRNSDSGDPHWCHFEILARYRATRG